MRSLTVDPETKRHWCWDCYFEYVGLAPEQDEWNGKNWFDFVGETEPTAFIYFPHLFGGTAYCKKHAIVRYTELRRFHKFPKLEPLEYIGHCPDDDVEEEAEKILDWRFTKLFGADYDWRAKTRWKRKEVITDGGA